MFRHSKSEDRRLTMALQEALNNIDPAPRVEVKSRNFPGRRRVIIQGLKLDSDSTDTDSSESMESESEESDTEKSEQEQSGNEGREEEEDGS